MARAAVVNIWTGTLAQGGSTITQQLVKNRWKPAQAGTRSLRRKIIEAALAYQVEQHWSKQKILEEYLNTIYFGHQAYGVEAAAEVYFGVHAKDLQPHQAALLAALVQNPTDYDPMQHPKTAAGAADSSCSASCCSRATSTPSSTASPTPSRCCRGAGRSASRPRRRRSRTTSSTTCASS